MRRLDDGTERTAKPSAISTTRSSGHADDLRIWISLDHTAIGLSRDVVSFVYEEEIRRRQIITAADAACMKGLNRRDLDPCGAVKRFTGQDHPGVNTELGKRVARLKHQLTSMSEEQHMLILGSADDLAGHYRLAGAGGRNDQRPLVVLDLVYDPLLVRV